MSATPSHTRLFLFGSVFFIFVVSIAAAFSSGMLMQGKFSITSPSAPDSSVLTGFDSCGSGVTSSNTIFLSPTWPTPGPGTSDGSYKKPYKTLATLQTHLNSHPTVNVVCFNGSHSGVLDLSTLTGATIKVYEYTSTTSSLTYSGATGAIKLKSGSSLTMNGIDIKGNLSFTNPTTLSLSNLSMDASGVVNGILVTGGDKVTMSNVKVEKSSGGAIYLLDLATVSLSKLNLPSAGGAGVQLQNVDTASIKDSTIETPKAMNIAAFDVGALKVEGSTLTNDGDQNGIQIKESGTLTVSSSSLENVTEGVSAEELEKVELQATTINTAKNGIFYKNDDVTGTLLVSDSEFFNTTSNGAYAYGINTIGVEDSLFEDIGSAGVFMTNNGGLDIENTTFKTVNMAVYGEGDFDDVSIADSSAEDVVDDAFNFDDAMLQNVSLVNNAARRVGDIVFTLRSAKTALIKDNVFEQYAEAGITLYSVNETCRIEGNDMKGSLTGAVPYMGIGFQCEGGATVFNNFSSYNNRGMYTYAKAPVTVYHNTVAYNSTYGFEFFADAEITFMDNIAYGNKSDMRVGEGFDFVSDYNIYGGIFDLATKPLSFTDWQFKHGGDTHSLIADPIFTHTVSGGPKTDLHIDSSSPAVDAGTDVGLTDDIDGDTRSTPDIGADEL